MEFAKRMDRFGEGVFTMLAQMKHRRLEEGKEIVDLSIGAPNIPPAPHILKVLSEECLVPENYIYAINDQKELLNAVSRRRKSVLFWAPRRAWPILPCRLWTRATGYWFRIPAIRYLRTARLWQARPCTICRRKKRIITL